MEVLVLSRGSSDGSEQVFDFARIILLVIITLLMFLLRVYICLLGCLLGDHTLVLWLDVDVAHVLSLHIFVHHHLIVIPVSVNFRVLPSVVIVLILMTIWEHRGTTLLTIVSIIRVATVSVVLDLVIVDQLGMVVPQSLTGFGKEHRVNLGAVE